MAKAAVINKKNFRFGFWISLLIPVYFGLVSLAYRLGHFPIVQDDQRLHLVWLQQWIDPQLFANDLLARYYQSIQPIGFRTVYWLAAQIGIAPMTLAAVLPLILALLSSIFLYRVTVRLLPHPIAPVLAVLIFNQNIWCKDDLIAAAPRSFAYLLLILFLDRVIAINRSPQKRRLQLAGSCLLVLALQGLFYPQILLVSLGVLWLQLMHWQQNRLEFSREPWRYGLAIAALILTGIILLGFSHSASEFGAMFSAAEMRSMPEFQPGGRRAYFGVNPLRFWFGGASGLRFPLFPPILWAAIGLPFLLKSRFAPAIRPEGAVLAQTMTASIGLFGLAHLTLPLLYLPSRYTFYSSRVVMAIAAGTVLALLIDRFWQWVDQSRRTGLQARDRIGVGLAVLFAIVAVIVPAIPPLFLSNQGWITASETELYDFLATQPKNSMIATLSPAADNIPAFAGRSVLFSPELALPYHSGFYREMQQRIGDVIRAQYSSEIAAVQSAIEKYGIRLWITESDSFDSDYLLKQSWLMNSSIRSTVLETIASLAPDQTPVLQTASQQCVVFSWKTYRVIEASCVLQQAEELGLKSL